MMDGGGKMNDDVMRENNTLLNLKETDIVESEYYSNFLTTKQFSNYRQITAKELFLVGKNSSLFRNKIMGIKKDYIYDSVIHGITHNERVALLAYYIACKLELPLIEQELIIDAALYHDTGRINDFEDVFHGDRSASKIEEIITDKNEDYKKVLKVIIKCHSHNDWEMDSIIMNESVNLEKAKILAAILKDADALDRIRFFGLNPSFLRLDVSKQLLNASAGIYFSYSPIRSQKRNLSKRNKHTTKI